MIPVAAVVAKVATAARNVAAVAQRARSAQKAYRTAAYVTATHKAAQQSRVYRVGNQFRATVGRVHDGTETAQRRVGKALAVATSPSLVLDGLDAGESWLTAGYGDRRPMPRGVKWVAIFVLVTYLPFTLVRTVPDLPVIPGLPGSPSWGAVWRLTAGDGGGGVVADPRQDAPYMFRFSSSQCRGFGVQQAGDSDGGVVPYLSTLAKGAGVAVKEKVADKENIDAYWAWVNGAAKVVVGGFSGGLMGGPDAADDPAVQEYDKLVRGEARAVADLCACPAPGVSAQGGAGADLARAAASAAGFTGQDLEVAVAVAGAESNYVPTAANPSSTARGMWQIMLSAHPKLVAGRDWRDPYVNAQMAYAVWQDAGQRWSPWAVYNSGAYKRFLGNAETAPAAQGECASGGGTSTITAPTLCPPSNSPAERGLSPAALTVLRCGAAQFPQVTSFAGVGPRGNVSDHPSGRAVDLMVPAWQTNAGRAFGTQVADWYVANAKALNIRYVIWNDRINSVDGRGWRPYGNPQCRSVGCGSPTLRHLDHVHVSVNASPTI